MLVQFDEGDNDISTLCCASREQPSIVPAHDRASYLAGG